MNIDTGEIRNFEPTESLPKKWGPVPSVGTRVEILYKQKLRGGVTSTRKISGVVVEIQTGKPGRLLIEMSPFSR